MPLAVLRRFTNRHAPKGSFRANVLTLMTGTTIAQVIPIAVSPILSRIYTPHDYGIFALFMAVASLIFVIATGRYEMAIMLPDNDEEAINIVALSGTVTFFISLITLLIVWIFNAAITSLIKNNEISKWLYCVPLAAFFTGIIQTLNYWLSRKKQYANLAIRRVYQSIATAGITIGMGLSGYGASGLIIASIMGQGIAIGIMGWQVWREDGSKFGSVTKIKMIELAKRYKDFPRVNSLHVFVDMLQSSCVTFLISSFFGGAILGAYSFAIRILKSPTALISASVSQVFYQRASETYNNSGNLPALLSKTMSRLALISFPIFIIIAIYAPNVFVILFGKNWKEAGIFAQILSPWILINFIVTPLSYIPAILHSQKAWFFVTLIGNTLPLLAIYYGGYIVKDIQIGLLLFSALFTFSTLFEINWIIRTARKRNCRIC